MPTSYEAVLMSYLVYKYQEKKKILLNENVRDNYLFYHPQANSSTDIKFLFSPCPIFTCSSQTYYAANFLSTKGWEIYDNYDMNILGYQGVAFINYNSKEIVIAHRGTTIGIDEGSEANYKDDIEILKVKDGKMPEILSSAIFLIAKVIQKRDKERINYKIWQTGHSLGGLLAEFGAAYIANPPKEENVLKEKGSSYFKLHKPQISDANAMKSKYHKLFS